jgi:hypothetical protein
MRLFGILFVLILPLVLLVKPPRTSKSLSDEAAH